MTDPKAMRKKLIAFRNRFAKVAGKEFYIGSIHGWGASACGATHCVQGWAEHWGLAKARGVSEKGYIQRFADAFGLTYWQAHHITSPGAYGSPNPRVSTAVKHINDVLAGKVVDRDA